MSKMYINRYRIVQCVCWSFRLFSVYISVVCSGNVPPLASAVQSDCVRRPIRLRSPSDQIAFAAWSDCVRCPIGRRSVNDDKATATAALTLKWLFADTRRKLSKRTWKSRKTRGFIWLIRRNNLYLRCLSYITPLTLADDRQTIERRKNLLSTKKPFILWT